MGLRGQRYTFFKCTCEGCTANKIQLPRKKGDMREKGHIKTMWCYKCKKETDHIEQHQEFEFGMFLNGEKVVQCT